MSAEGFQRQTAVVAGGAAPGRENGVGTFARFDNPSDLDISPDGSVLYVADTGNHLVRA